MSRTGRQPLRLAGPMSEATPTAPASSSLDPTGSDGDASPEDEGSAAAPRSADRPRLPVVMPEPGTVVVHCNRGDYLPLMTALKADGYDLPVGVTGVDYLTHPGRDLPPRIKPERFEVVVELLSLAPSPAGPGALPGPGGRSRACRPCSTCGPAPKPTSERPTTCSGSASTATPTCPGS